MKYDIKNDELEKFVELNNNIRSYFQTLEEGEEWESNIQGLKK